MKHVGRHGAGALLCMALVGGSARPAAATWSILAVDPETREVGVAAASCSYMVQGIEGVVPGVGILAVQADSNADARAKGVERMEAGADAAAILDAMKAEEFSPEEQQYAVIVLGEESEPRVFTGGADEAWSGARTGDGFCVQGNTLTDRGVVDRTFAAYERALRDPRLTMADRLLAAIAEGGDGGGDARCGEQRATSAFVKVVRPDDQARVPYLNLVVFGAEEGGVNAVARLVEEYVRWKAGKKGTSTQVYLVP